MSELGSISPLLLHGVVPLGWAPRRLGGIADITGGTTPSRKESSYWGGKIPWATPTDITSRPAGVLTIERTAEGLDDIAIEETSVRVLPVGTVLMTSRATIGEVAINTVPMATNQGFCNFVPKQETDPRFLAYWLAGNRRRLVRLAGGSTFLELAKRDARRVRIHLPPLPEQRKIAAILSSVDDAIAATRKAIEQTKRVKQGLLQTLMTRGIGHTRFKKTKIGEIPEKWELVPLGDVCAHITKGATPTTYGYDWVDACDNGILFLRSECVSEQGFQLVGSEYISEAAHEALSRSEVRAGDVLVTITGNVGRVAQFPANIQSANINQHIARVRVERADLLQDFVHLALQAKKQRDRFETIVTGLAYPQLSLKQIRETLIPKPSVEEQHTIVERMSIVLDMHSRSKACLVSWQQIKRGLMQDLLTGRVRVHPD